MDSGGGHYQRRRSVERPDDGDRVRELRPFLHVRGGGGPAAASSFGHFARVGLRQKRVYLTHRRRRALGFSGVCCVSLVLTGEPPTLKPKTSLGRSFCFRHVSGYHREDTEVPRQPAACSQADGNGPSRSRSAISLCSVFTIRSTRAWHISALPLLCLGSRSTVAACSLMAWVGY